MADYKIPVPEERKEPTGWLKSGAAENNLKHKCRYSAWRYDLCDRCVRLRKEFTDQ